MNDCEYLILINSINKNTVSIYFVSSKTNGKTSSKALIKPKL